MTTITLAQIASSHQAVALPALPSPLAENFTFDELRIGDHQSLTHTLTADDVRTFAAMTGDNNPSNHHITLACRCTNQHGDDVITGSAQVLAPEEKVMRPSPASALPTLIGRSDRFAGLFQRVAGLQAIKVAVVYPCTEGTLQGALQAAQMGLIVPVFIGPKARIEALASQCHLDLSPYRVVDAPNTQEAARTAVSMASQHEVQALMKGCLHTDELLDEVLDKAHGLCTARHVSHVFVLDLPSLPRPILISDATLKARGDMQTRRHTVQNAIDLAHLLGVAKPKVAILGGAETLDVGTHSAADTASLCAMARNGQITGGVLDGPLSLDNALSLQAALDHGIVSPVAGHADVLVVPALYAGNTITRQLQYLADAQVAGVVMGTRVPVILSSPADGLLATPASCAIALLMTRARPDDTPAEVQHWLQQG
jgi:phosphate acetyltransferase